MSRCDRRPPTADRQFLAAVGGRPSAVGNEEEIL